MWTNSPATLGLAQRTILWYYLRVKKKLSGVGNDEKVVEELVKTGAGITYSEETPFGGRKQTVFARSIVYKSHLSCLLWRGSLSVHPSYVYYNNHRHVPPVQGLKCISTGREKEQQRWPSTSWKSKHDLLLYGFYVSSTQSFSFSCSDLSFSLSHDRALVIHKSWVV